MFLKPGFFRRNTLEIAHDLIGAELYHRKGRAVTSGIIVETEAYLGHLDPASHSYLGPTQRNAPMFEAGGITYVYFIYGNHFCFNLVTEDAGFGSAVLIRALEPKTGISTMRRRRKRKTLRDLASGPGKLTQAMGISLKENGLSLNPEKIWVEKNTREQERKIATTPRIGIQKGQDKLYRFIDRNSAFISRPIA